VIGNWASIAGGMMPRLPRQRSAAVLHGVSAVVAVFGVALSVDYGRAASVKADLQAATDAAALAASSAICSSKEEQMVLAQGVFNATYHWDPSRPPVLVPQIAIGEDGVRVSATERVETSMGQYAGVEWMEVNAASYAMAPWRVGAWSCLAPARDYLEALLELSSSRSSASVAPERPRWSETGMRPRMMPRRYGG